MDKMLRLDFLINYPQNKDANLEFLCSYPNEFLLDSVRQKSIDSVLRDIANIFSYSKIDFFNYEVGDFLELFLLVPEDKKALFFPSMSNLAFRAFSLLQTSNISLGKMAGFSLSNDELSAQIKDFDFIFLSIVNQDIFTINDISHAISTHQNKIFFVDISLGIHHLDLNVFCGLKNVVLMLNGENIGLFKNNGILISNINLGLKNIYKIGSERAFSRAIQKVLNRPHIQDTKYTFFQILQNVLKDRISTFCSLDATLPNSIPLRIHKIKARTITQMLMIDNIYLVNGIDCLHGYFSPSYVLDILGFTPDERSELLSINYQKLSEKEMYYIAEMLQKTID